MYQKKYFSSSEEMVAKIVSFLLNCLFVIVFFLAETKLDFSWMEAIFLVTVFVVLYEILGYIFFLIFKFFSTNKSETKEVKKNSAITDSEALPSNDSSSQENYD